MAAAYDTYDYPSYWEGRAYEHRSEIIALKSLLEKIRKVHTILEIGAGYGRLTPFYEFRASHIILSDPSAKLLSSARENLRRKKIKFLQAKVENLPQKIRAHSIDLTIMVRVLHHIENIDKTFSIIRRITKQNGYLILEYANKRHLKALIGEFRHGNLTFPLEIFPKEVSTKKRRKKFLPFRNYHPDTIKEKLGRHGFQILETRSVSNFRVPFLKRRLPIELIMKIENLLQKPLAKISFGPSIFILAKKVK